EPLGEEGSPSGRARAVLEPLLEDPLPRRETPAPSNAPIREVLEHEGIRCSDAEGSLNVEMEGPGTGPVVVRARMRLGGVASFFVPLPHVRGMGARKKLL